MLRSVLSTTLSLVALLALPAVGADVEIRAVGVGFDGAYKAGEWTRLRVQFAATRPLPVQVVIETVTSDAAGSLAIRTSNPVSMSHDATAAQVETTFQAGRFGSDLIVRLKTTAGDLLSERRFRAASDALPQALPKGTALWVTAHGTADSRNDAPQFTLPVPAGVVGAQIDGLLPAESLSYAAADVLLLRGDLAPTAEQAEALRQWVVGGGHLAIALGRFTDSFRKSALSNWIPIEVGETVQLRDLSPIEIYSGSERRLPARARVRAARLNGAVQVLLESSDTAIVARSPYGFGRVTLFAIDLDDFPFSNWAGLPGLIQRSVRGDDRDAGAGRGRVRTVPGVTDLGTQLLRSEERFSDVSRPSVGLALLLLLVYAAVVGPLDYLFVHRVLRRPALTWLTLPLLVAIAAWWLHRSAIAANGTRSLRNELHVVDLDVASGTLRGRSGLTLYAAQPTRVEIAITPAFGSAKSETTAMQPHLAWSAPPEETFGGMYRDASGGLFHPQYQMLPPGEAARAEDIPMLVGASRTFTATWQHGGENRLVETDLVSRGRGRLEGSISHHLPGPVTDYIVAFGGRIFLPREPEWHPDEPIQMGSAAFDRSDLDSFLTRRVASQIERKRGSGGSDYIVTETAYDPLGTGLDALMRMLTFHEAAGGRGYTGLTNSPNSRSDLTPLLRLRRAVVIGRLQQPAALVTVSDDDGDAFEENRQSTFVRFVIPVEQAAIEPVRTLPSADPNENR